MMPYRGELIFIQRHGRWGGSYSSCFAWPPWSTALDSSSMWTAVENRFQKYGSRTRAIMIWCAIDPRWTRWFQCCCVMVGRMIQGIVAWPAHSRATTDVWGCNSKTIDRIEVDVFDWCSELKVDSNLPADRRDTPTVRRQARGDSCTYPPARWALAIKSRVWNSTRWHMYILPWRLKCRSKHDRRHVQF